MKNTEELNIEYNKETNEIINKKLIECAQEVVDNLSKEFDEFLFKLNKTNNTTDDNMENYLHLLKMDFNKNNSSKNIL